MSIKIIVNGASGKMGRITVDTINKETDFALVGKTGSKDDLAKIIQNSKADIVIDFTTPQTVYRNAQLIIENNVRPVIGTTGLTLEQINSLQQQCRQRSLGGVIAPNFSLGAILMMKYAKDAAHFLTDVEIIEMHHPQKLDAPSGTSKKTAEMIAQSRKERGVSTIAPTDKTQARGFNHQGIPIHSVRLPGYFAHQEVIFGNQGETLTIRHDGMDRISMMPGVVLACRKVMALHELVYGLEHLMS